MGQEPLLGRAALLYARALHWLHGNGKAPGTADLDAHPGLSHEREINCHWVRDTELLGLFLMAEESTVTYITHLWRMVPKEQKDTELASIFSAKHKLLNNYIIREHVSKLTQRAGGKRKVSQIQENSTSMGEKIN